MKKCTGCGEEKEITEFWKDKIKHDGHNSRCIPCAIKSRKITKDAIVYRNYYKKHAELYPHKIRAQRYIQYAVRSGKLKRGHCFLCGADQNIEGHHINYKFKEKVIWLCREHHREFHSTWKETL